MLTERGELLRSLDAHATSLSHGYGSMWGTDDLGDRLLRFDPRSGDELGSVELPHPSGPVDVAATDDGVWVAAPRAGGLLRVDPATMALAGAAIPLPGIAAVSAAGTDVWAVMPAYDSAARIEAASGRVALRAQVCDTPVAVAAVPDGGGAWIACSTARAVWHIASDGTPTVSVALDGVPTDVALDADRVWVTLRED